MDSTNSATRAFEIPLEQLGDPWPSLRELWDQIEPDQEIRAEYGFPDGFRLRRGDVDNLLRLTGFATLSHARLRHSDNHRGWVVTAKKRPRSAAPLSCTVIVPCRNEVDNVEEVVRRVPAMGTKTEILFVDGASTDGTPERIDLLVQENPDKHIRLLRQEGNTGKGGATFQGLAAAMGDVVMICDADMTVRPEDLPRFYYALAENVADCANGTRMIYPMASAAMPRLNQVGNKLFSAYLSWLLGTRVTDTLCGTKAVLKRDIPKLLEARPLFGGHDPWGDFDLLLGVGWAGMSLIDVPVRYEARQAGESKMRPLTHGTALAQTCFTGAVRIKAPFGKHGRA